jgi:hemolysin III
MEEQSPKFDTPYARKFDAPFDTETLEMMYLSPRDELANIATHGLGAVLGVVGIFILWKASEGQELGLQLSCLAFGLTTVVVYLFSTLSHAVNPPKARHVLRSWDQGCIYLLIAGTYSPFIWTGADTAMRGPLMAAVWLAAAVGFWLKVVSTRQITGVSSLYYLLLGWLPSIPLVSGTSSVCLRWMMYGGLCYTSGLIFWYLSNRIQFTHTAWHVMVMLGTGCHFYAVMLLLDASPVA